MKFTTKHDLRFLLSIPIGIVGGFVCGYAILSFGMLIGRSGTTGTEYVGYWTPTVWFDALIYGGLIGAIMMPIAYLTHLCKTGFMPAIIPAAVGTIGGGLVGALAGPPLAVVAGIIGFFIAVGYIARRKSKLP